MGTRVAVGADHAGFRTKEDLKPLLEALGLEVVDLGTHTESACDYPDHARSVAGAVSTRRADWGVLVCGSGTGMAIAANRSAHVRAAVCPDAEYARLARSHNDANILCLGARLVPPERVPEIVRTFFDTPFEGGRHAARVGKLEHR